MTKEGLEVSNSEVEKRLRSLIGLWKTHKQLQKDYPGSLVMLMDTPSPCDLLVVDPQGGSTVAVEVKSAKSSSAASRRLTPAQKGLRALLESRKDWKVVHNKYVLYEGPDGKDFVKKVH